MPPDEFDDELNAAVRTRAVPMRKPGWRSEVWSVIQALIDDIAYFRWAFAGLGAVIVAANF